MEIQRIRALRGPNRWSRHTSVEALVRCDDVECDIAAIAGFEQKIRQRFPGLSALPRCPQGRVTMAHLLATATLSLQAQAGCPVTFMHTQDTDETGVYYVVVEYSEEEVGRSALNSALALIEAAYQGTDFDAPSVVRKLTDLDEDVRLGPSTGSIVTAAVARGIPYSRLTSGSMVQFGWGSKRRRIQAAEIDSTSAVAESIAQDKDLTKQLLRAAGVPAPIGQPVNTLQEALDVAHDIGWPVVTKPLDGNQGKGVTVNIVSDDHLAKAYESAAIYGQVMVEKFLPGDDFRLLVVGNRLIAAARRDPPSVIGDGEHTVAQLVAIVNQDPRRGEGHATSLTKMRLDDIAKVRLAAQNLSVDDVPEKGRRVILRNNANLSTGGSATDVTDDVHPEVAARAVAAAQMVGLHICGVDAVCETVMKPFEEQSGGIVEVNAAPGLRMHLSPSFGKGRNVGEAIVQHLFKAGENGRIPVVAVTGTNGKTTTTRLITHLMSSAGLRTGMTNTDGVYVQGRQIDSGDCSGPRSARNVLSHPDVDAAVFECARGGILREGLGFDACQVAVVTNIGEGDHLGMNHIHTAEQLATVKGVIVHNVSPQGYGVLNAADPIVAAMEANCPGQVIFFATDRHHPVMERHRAQGKRCVFVEDGDLVCVEGHWRENIPLKDIPITLGGAVGFQVENVMASVAAAWGCDLSWEAIRAGLLSFSADRDNAPGRFNVLNYRGATLIADYGHNPDAIRALIEAVEAMPGAAGQRRVAVISGAGDRRDEDLTGQTLLLGKAFDEVVLYQDACQRGRQEGEVIALLRRGLENAPRTQRVHEITGEFLAIDTALNALNPGDLCLVLVDQVQEALAHLHLRVAEGA